MKKITIQSSINASLQEVWDYWTTPKHIINWNFATDEWQCPFATNDLTPEGKFSWRMEAKDGSMGFDYAGVYKLIVPFKSIEKVLNDGRHVSIQFIDNNGVTKIIESFEPDENDLELQKMGWQAILNNFKKYVESAV